MEDLAVLAATIYVLLGGLALISILLAVLSRRKKLKPWMAIVFNAITGLGAILASALVGRLA
jgi:VIT1/CCC1 family predicted Fe2+/Mn2+ transporter